MLLSELIADIEGLETVGMTDVPLTGLSADSREVRAGFLFAAMPGSKGSGTAFIDAAVKAGAAAVLAPHGTLPVAGVAMILSDNPRLAFAKLAARFYGLQPAHVAAVTGTNGKSSTVSFCRQIWEQLGYAAASLGTIGVTGPGINRPGLLTTPDPVVLHAEAASLAGDGVTHLAFEASSIGLDQHRSDGLTLTAAGFTNLTRDHLDYHGTMEKYLAAKARLFTAVLPPDGTAVINMDTPVSAPLRDQVLAAGRRVVEVGRAGKDIRLNAHKSLPAGQFIEISVFGTHYGIELPLVGDFQAYNALLALGLVLADEPADDERRKQAVLTLEKLQPVRGRLELAATLQNGAAVYVDYAHTPDGLETMLKALRPHCHGRLHVVFGCGGDRDRGKRPMMGEIAARLADRVIVTDDNPRTEDAAAIRAEVMAGCPDATNIGGRRDAIAAGIRALQPGDVLAVAGKGHEQGQIVGKDVLPFDDVTEVKNAANRSAA